MTFTQWGFLGLAALLIVGHWHLPHQARNPWLLAGSWLFYAWWDPRFLALLLGVTAVTWTSGRRIHLLQHAGRRSAAKWWVAFAVVVGVGTLATFKYLNFFYLSAVDTASKLGINIDAAPIRIVLPVGISFYIFQSLSYVIDVYRGDIEAERGFVDYALFVAFFPQLVAGPIERARDLLPQLQRTARPAPDSWQVATGLALIARGYIRKIVIADPLSTVVGSAQLEHGFWPAVIAAVAFGIQLYCDFAAYTDIARGCARLLGIELTENFHRPYGGPTITAFWRRWHATLGRWFHSYVYLPLGGNRRGERRTLENLFAVALLSGLWHGAAFTFVVWGAIHGVALVVERSSGWYRLTRGTIPSHVWTLTIVGVGWIFFSAETVSAAVGKVFDLFTFAELTEVFAHGATLWWLTVAALATGAIDRYSIGPRGISALRGLLGRPALAGVAITTVVVGCVLMASAHVGEPFAYFRF